MPGGGSTPAPLEDAITAKKATTAKKSTGKRPAEAPDTSQDDVLVEFVRALPKAELHIHLEGAVRLTTLHELWARAPAAWRRRAEGMVEPLLGRPLNLEGISVDELSRVVQPDGSRRGHAVLGAAVHCVAGALQDSDSLRRVARELVEDLAIQNVRYTEVRLAPLMHVHGGLPLQAVIESVLEGLAAGTQASKGKTRARLIVAGVRDDLAGTVVAAEVACAYKGDGVVAFDMVGPEAGFPPRKHRAAFDIVRAHMLPVTMHAGEGYGPRSIREAIFEATARRLGHATRVFQDGDLFRYVVDQRIPVECCLSANMMTHTVESIGSHPLRTFVKKGVRVCLCSEYPLFTRSTLEDEYLLAARECCLSVGELAWVALNGFRSTFQRHDAARALRISVHDEIMKARALATKRLGLEPRA